MPAATRRITPLMLRQRLRAEGVLFRAYRCWTAAATWTCLPCRTDLAELESPPLRAWIGVADARLGSGQFHYQYLGREMPPAGSGDDAGSVVGGPADLSPFGELDRAAFLESAFQERIVFSRRQWTSGHGEPVRFDRLVLPLRGEQPGTAIVLFAQDCAHLPDRPAPAGADRLPAWPAGRVSEMERLALSAIDPAHEHRSSG